ncbi:hypothetical protein CCH79_00016283, partial [Gambusia affinis]
FGSIKLSDDECAVVASALKSNLHLTELEIRKIIKLKDPGMKHLCEILENPVSIVKSLGLKSCSLSEVSWSSLASALKFNSSHLTALDLYENNLKDAGVKELCAFLQNPECKLQKLKQVFILEHCSLSEIGCDYLASALKSNPSHLTELNMSHNNLKDAGVKQLCGFLQNPECKLHVLIFWDCRLSEISCDYLVSALKSNPSHLTGLELGQNRELKDAGVKQLCESRILSKISCDCLASALKSSPSHLTGLYLEGNGLKDSDVEQLKDLVKDV